MLIDVLPSAFLDLSRLKVPLLSLATFDLHSSTDLGAVRCDVMGMSL